VETHRGGQLRLRINAEAGEHCFAIDALRVERRVVAGRETRVDIVPDKAGSFPFYDCLSAEGRRLTGTLVVTD
jgi:heme/copper-type cytochrome/quinol oxidase subunit 2